MAASINTSDRAPSQFSCTTGVLVKPVSFVRPFLSRFNHYPNPASGVGLFSSCFVYGMVCGCLALASFGFGTPLDISCPTFLSLLRSSRVQLEVRIESLACLVCAYYMFVTLLVDPNPFGTRSAIREVTPGILG